MRSDLKKIKRENKGIRFVTEYVHYRTGKLMRACDYGYKAWPFRKGRKG